MPDRDDEFAPCPSWVGWDHVEFVCSRPAAHLGEHRFYEAEFTVTWADGRTEAPDGS